MSAATPLPWTLVRRSGDAGRVIADRGGRRGDGQACPRRPRPPTTDRSGGRG